MTTRRPLLTAEEIWRTYDDAEQRLTASVSERMLDLAELRPGMCVLDLATGRGEPAVRAAHRVGPTGTVLGVDVSEGMLQMARERAAREGLANLDLRAMNVETLEGVPEAFFHATLARWCLMYLDSPVAALSAARRAMAPRGVLVAAVWAEPERVPYFTLPRRVLGKYLVLPPIDPEAPGTFRYADTGRLHRDFAAAGFTIEHVEELEVAVMEAATGAELVAWTRAFGLTRLLNGLPEETQQAWEAELVKETEPLRKDGFVRLGGVTRIVVASAAEQPRLGRTDYRGSAIAARKSRGGPGEGQGSLISIHGPRRSGSELHLRKHSTPCEPLPMEARGGVGRKWSRDVVTGLEQTESGGDAQTGRPPDWTGL